MRRPGLTRGICALVIGLVWGIVTAPAAAEPIFVTGAGPGGGPHVQVFDGRTGKPLFGFFAYDPLFTGGVRVSAADVNGDGVADVITAPGPGGSPHVRIFDGAALLTQSLVELFGFMAYDVAFSGGVYVAAAPAAPTTPPASSPVVHTIQAFAFAPDNPSVVLRDGFGSLSCTSACTLNAAVFLAEGAILQALELEACDTSAAGMVTGAFFLTVAPAQTSGGTGLATTGLSEAPGCGIFVAMGLSQVQIKNSDESYFVQVNITGGSPTTRFQAVRIRHQNP
jgi:hypothetical protein